MLRRVQPVLVLGAVAAVFFFIGDRMEPWFDHPANQLRAEAGAHSAKPAALPVLRSKAVAPAAEPAIASVGPATEAAAPKPLPAAAEPAADAEATPPANPESSALSGRDPVSDLEFYEEKDLPEVAGQGDANKPAHDVDMIDEPAVDDTSAPAAAPAAGDAPKSDN